VTNFAPYPLTFEPILIEKVWGGDTLSRFGKHLPAGVSIGESWEVADLPLAIEGGRSVIDAGPASGTTLHDVITDHQTALLGTTPPTTQGGFPLLIKLLDAQKNLSVQVHPDAAYATEHPDAHLKSEAWIVLAAAPGAMIYKGLTAGTTAAIFQEAIQTGAVPSCLHGVEAVVGDVHYLPSGTCHALGAGVLVAEVQTPSDTTFRVDDWGRIGRTMHIEEAMQCIDFTSPPPVTTPDPIVTDGGHSCQRLLETEYFTVHRITGHSEASRAIVAGDRPVILMQTCGNATITAPGPRPQTELVPGTTAVIPAALVGSVLKMSPGSETLEITLPCPTQGLLA
jgi:mannose-6-phosphate isomerase